MQTVQRGPLPLRVNDATQRRRRAMSTKKTFLAGLFVAVGLVASNVQLTDVGQFGPFPTAAEARADDEGFDDGGYYEAYQGDADDYQPDEGFEHGGYDEAYHGDLGDADDFDDSMAGEASED